MSFRDSSIRSQRTTPTTKTLWACPCGGDPVIYRHLLTDDEHTKTRQHQYWLTLIITPLLASSGGERMSSTAPFSAPSPSFIRPRAAVPVREEPPKSKPISEKDFNLLEERVRRLEIMIS